ncbi:MAG: Ig-like domain-containing protein [Methylococcales bacterium]|nr:Ig-like domain-containing protein [Methylococcales bacterium]
MADKTPPKLESSNPSANAVTVAVTQNIVLTFDEAIKAGTGYVTISNGKSPKKIKVSDTTQVTIKDNVLTVNPKADLALGSHYSVTIDNKAIKDLAGNLYAGIKSVTELSFDTVAADKTPPKLLGSIPEANAQEVKVNQNLTLTFDEPIKAGIGYITISNGKSPKKIKVSDTTQVTIKDNVLTVNPKADLALDNHYSVTIDNKALKDLAGNAFVGITDITALSFDTVGIPVDSTPPELVSSKPKSQQTKVTTSQNITLTFNEKIKVGSGVITISNGTDVREIDITDKTQVKISNKVLTINPKSNLVANSRYSVAIDETAITDLAGNPYAGIDSPDVLYFDTKPQAVDKTSPNPISSTPKAGAKDVDVGQNIVLTFNEIVKAGTGNIVISNEKGSLRIPVSDKTQVSVNGQEVVINPSKDLEAASVYTLTMDIGAIKDTSNNNAYDLKKLFPFSFTTSATPTVIDTTPPALVSLLPKDESHDVAQNADFIFKFNEPVIVGKGFITISDGAKDVRKIDIKDKQITIDNDQLMINPTLNLKADTSYFIKIDKGAIKDLAGNDFAGILDTKTFNFKTGAFALITGFVIDDYLANATVTIQGTDGVFYNVYTDNYGHFSFPKDTPVRPMTIVGGTDIGTGLAFKGQLSAPAGATVVTPLTTLQQVLIERGQTAAQAQATIAKAFGFDSSKINVMTYDPIDSVKSSTSSTKTSALNVFATSTKIVNLLITASEILQRSSTTTISTTEAGNLVVNSLLNSIDKAKDTKIDLNNLSFLKEVFLGATTVDKDIKFDATKIGLVDDVFAKVVADTSANIDSAISNAKTQSTSTVLGNVSRVSNFNQNTATTSIVTAIENPKTFDEKTLLESLTGSTADDAIKNTLIPSDSPTPTPPPTENGTGSAPTPSGGGTTGSGTPTPTPTPTSILTLSLASDTGTSNDNITSNGQINVANLLGGAIWEYSINGGGKQAGSGSSISVVGDGNKSVVVTQTDAKNVEKTASLTFVLDTTPPLAPTLSSKSGVVTDGTVTVTTTESNWEYNLNGSGWTKGSGSSFSTGAAGNKSVLVHQIDAAGNVSSNASLNFVLAAGALATPTLSLAADTGKSFTDSITSNGQVNVANLASGATWQYSLDNETTWITGSGSSFNVLGDGSKAVIVKQTLNSIEKKSAPLSFTLDATPPANKSQLTLNADTGISSTDKLTKTGQVNVANLDGDWQYSTDGGKSWISGSGSNFTLTGDGSKSVIVRQTDIAGNAIVSDALAFTLDATVPATPTLSLANDTGNPTDKITSDGKVNVAKLETGVSWNYSVDNGNTWNLGSGSSLTLTSDGNKSVLVKQTDTAGNESNSGRLDFTLTATQPLAPKISLAFDTGNPADSITNNGQVNVIVESGESWQYSIDQGTNWIKGSGSSFVVTGDGAKKVLVKKMDASGTSSTDSSLSFTLATKIPATPSIDSVTSDGQVNISGLNSDATWQYSLDGNVWNVGSGNSFKITGNGAKTLHVKQLDGAGNVSVDASLNFTFTSGSYTGTPQDIASNLSSLESQAITLSGITLISSIPKVSLILTKSQLLNNQNALSRISGTTNLGSFQIELEAKSELTAKEMADLLPIVGAKVKSNSITIKDSAQNVQVYWDQLHALNIDPPIGAIYFTDKVKPKLSLSLNQYDNELLLENSEQSGLLKFIKSPYSLVVYDVQTHDAITEALDTSISSVTITDTAAAISANFGNLLNVYDIGKLNAIIVTDNQALDVSQYRDFPEFAQVLGKISWLSTMSDFSNDYTNAAVSLITVKDSAQAVQTNLDLLQASIKKLLTIELTDDSIPTITLSQQQYKNDLSVLNKISTAHEFTIIAGLPDVVSSTSLATTTQMSFNGVPSNLDLSGNTPITISYDVTTADEVLQVSHFGEDTDKLQFTHLDNNTIEMLDTQLNGQAATWLHSSADNNHGIILLGVQTAHLAINNDSVTLI